MVMVGRGRGRIPKSGREHERVPDNPPLNLRSLSEANASRPLKNLEISNQIPTHRVDSPTNPAPAPQTDSVNTTT